MASSTGDKKTKSRRFLDRLKLKGSRSPSIVGEVINESPGNVSPSRNSTGDSPLAIRPKTNEGVDNVSTSNVAVEENPHIVTPSFTKSNVKEGLGIAVRFAQTLLKKIPECIEPTNPAKSALSLVKMIIEIKDGIGDNKDSLTECLHKTKTLLTEVVGRISEVSNSEAVNQEVVKYKNKIESETRNICELTEKLSSNVFQNLDYEAYKKSVQDISERINDATRLFMVDMQIIIARVTSQIHDDQKKASLKDLNPSKKADHRTVLERQSLKREVCTEGTRVRILEDISNWANDHMKNSPRVFWLTGQAGSGKTTIAYTIAKWFEKGQPTILGANFLCSRQFEETRSLSRLLPTIAYQLAHKCGPYQAGLHNHVGDKSAVVDRDIFDQMKELLIDPWCNARHPDDPPTYLIVIDALDELNDNGGSTFLGVLLRTLNQEHFVGLKFLVTSRMDPQIVELCDTFQSKEVCRLQDVPIEDAQSDVERYLDAKLPDIVGSPELAALRDRASGLFIYAATVVRIVTSLRSATHKEQMRRLNNLLSKPSGLSSVGKDKSPIDGLYEQILYDAFSDFMDEEELAPRLRILFTFLCTAERVSPSVAATLMDDDEDLAMAVLNDLHAVLYIQDGRVFWYHASFPDFLYSRSRSNFRVGDEKFSLWCDEATQQSLLASSCLRVMKSEAHGLRFNMGDRTSSYLLDAEHAEELSKQTANNITPVLQYSSFYWVHHLSSIPLTQDVDAVCSSVSDFLCLRILFWIEAMNLLGLSNQCTHMLRVARQWVLNSKCTTDTKSILARDILESANFATHFAGSTAAESTPHLYISSLATWKEESSLSQNWKSQFLHIPAFTRASTGKDAPLLTVEVPGIPCSAIAFSNDGTRIASGSDDGYVRTWYASSVTEVKILKGHTEKVLSVVFSSDDKWIASGCRDRTVRVWDASTGECLKAMDGHADMVLSLSFSRNGKRIVSGFYDGSMCLWDISTGTAEKVIVGHTGSVNSIALSGDESWIVSGSDDRSVRVWDTTTGDELKAMIGHSKGVSSVAISSDDALIASGSSDWSVRIWNATTGDALRTMNGYGLSVISVAFSGNGAWIVSGSEDHSVRVWDASSGELWKELKGHKSSVYSVAFSSDSMQLMSGSDDRTVRVWNVSTCSHCPPSPDLEKSEDHEDLSLDSVIVNSVAFSSDSKRVLFSTYDGLICIWDADSKPKLQVLKGCTQGGQSFAFSSDGTHLAWGSEYKLCVGDVSENVDMKVLEGHTDYIHSVAFSKDGTLLVSGSGQNDRTVRLWDQSTGAQLKVMKGHTNRICSVAFSGDGLKIVSGSWDKTVRVWDVLSGDNLRVIVGHKDWVNSVAFSTDGAKLVSGSYDKTVRVWETLSGRKLKILRGHTDSIYSVAFSIDGSHIVSGSGDHTVRIWNASSGKEISNLRGRHTDDVNSIAASSDGRSVVSGSSDGTVIVWDFDAPSWYTGEGNWILSYPSNVRLICVPPDSYVLQRSNCRILTGNSNNSSFDFDQCTQVVGTAWQNCYTPTHPGH